MLILNALILNAPTLMYGYISEIFNLIWVAVHDNKVIIFKFIRYIYLYKIDCY
jgi:FKBP12-rapamycin complex-associated protein